MKFSKTVTLSLATFMLGVATNQMTTVAKDEVPTKTVEIKERIPEYLKLDNPIVVKLQESYHDYNELQALYEDLSTSYDLLQEQLDNLLKSPVFNSQDVSVLSNVNTYQLKHALQGTNLEPLASAFVKAEKTYSINALFLTGLVAVESGWGTSDRAINDNNMSGYAVYNDNSVGKHFSSKEESIMETARLIAEDYLPQGAKFHTGKSIYEINQLYSADKNWNLKITRIARDLTNKAKMWGVE